MYKKRAIDIIEQIHENILNKLGQLNSDNEVNGKVFIEYLQEISSALADTSSSLEEEKLKGTCFENEYKEIADSSLDSYASTSNKLHKFTQEQQDIIDECQGDSSLIDTKMISDKFAMIQAQMTDEVSKANGTIKSLSNRVKELELQSSLDPLTKVFNRQALSSYFEAICTKGFKGTHVLMIDIDDFKKINDTFGHLAGDKVIIYLAKLLAKTLRDGDKVFRYGGEEFVVVLNRINSDKCMSIANRLVKLIASSNLIYKEHDIKMTVSMGGTYLKDSDNMSSVLDRADKALYVAKNGGKNRFEVEI